VKKMNISEQLENIRKKSEARSINKNKNTEANVIKNSVTKSNALVRSYYRFTLNEKRIMECLISKVDPRRTDNSGWSEADQISLKTTEFSETFKIDKQTAYRDMKVATKRLLKQVITVDEDDEDFPLMARATYHKNEGRITAQFNPWLMPHLQLLKGKFTSYPLKHAAEFKSAYTWRLYEILMSWSRPKSDTGGLIAGWTSIKVSELRELMGVPASYNYNMFYSNIFLPAKEEITTKVGIMIELSKHKTSRKITDFRIEFLEKSKKDDGKAA
jgi:plasmid replication initiation protein